MCNLLTTACRKCKAVKPVIFFPIYYFNYERLGAEDIRSYLLECLFCRYKKGDSRRDADNTLHNPKSAMLSSDTARAKEKGIVNLEALCELCGKITGKSAVITHHPLDGMPYLTVSTCLECHIKKIHHYKVHLRKHKKKGERKAVKRSENKTSSLGFWGHGPIYTTGLEIKKPYWEYYAEVINFLSQPNSPEFDLYKHMFIRPPLP